ncbi:smoothelin isoform X8 [Sorex araneus]|uniref:smoothelin isoform X8 n=1 Tax=Sorex araneus TaxID=42254 RepID=UPI002433A105|nr:smoothelin isoform X8 [Sorex araneus]
MMADEAFAGLDEGALRKLLEGTADLAERRRIRSAIRELQRQELEREEEALASKRFRAERQDNKENWLHSQQREAEQRAALARLAAQLESMSDVEELTVLLRSAGEYEERKLIRAAIRRIRAQEIEAATLAGRLCSGHLNSGSREDSQGRAARRLARCEVPEREEQEQQPEGPKPSPAAESTSQNVTTVTVLLQAPHGATPSPPASPKTSPASASPEPPLEPAKAQTPDAETLGSPELPASLPSATSPESQELPAPPSTEERVVNTLLPGPPEPPAAHGPTRSLLDTKRTGPDLAGPRPCQRSLSVLSPRQLPQNQVPTTPGSGPSPFHRAGSVRDRVRTFTSDSPRPAGLQHGPSRVAPGPLTPARLPGSSFGSTTPASSSSGSSSRGTTDTSSRSSKEKPGTAQPLAQLQSCPREEGPRGRGLAARSLENGAGGARACSEEPSTPLPVAVGTAEPGGSMKTTFTIEIKDGRGQTAPSRVLLPTGSQRAELTMGVRASPAILSTGGKGKSSITQTGNPGTPSRLGSVTHVTSFSQASPGNRRGCSIKMEPEPAEAPAAAAEVANDTQQTLGDKAPGRPSPLSAEELMAIEDEGVLDKMLDQATDFEERKLIRAALRELRQRKRDGGGSTVVQTKTFSSSTSSSSTSSKKMGSIFDREDETSPRPGSLAALEKRQAEKKKELMKAQSLPKTSASQARKAMIEKLEKEGNAAGSPGTPRAGVQRSTSFGVPNANSIKQMLLDWCRAKTRGYEHVDIQNFSSSWSDGMAFCALVHNFFPEAFDYGQLSPQNRRQNFEVAFSSAETHADCPQLLDTEDMVRLREPDWKCVYTYIQEFYRCLVQKGLVKTKKS